MLVQRNGQRVTTQELAPLAFAGFAHFTAMQVREGRVRGLDLHLDRLHRASTELFGGALPEDQVRSYVRAALEASSADLSLRVTMYSSAEKSTTPGASAEPDVLIRTGAPAAAPKGPVALAVVEHERFLPAIKHVGEIAKAYFHRQAIQQGLDDAAFVDRRGRFSEATIWNLAFWDGSAVVWPEAAKLTGVTMGIVRRQLDSIGIPQREEPIEMDDLPAMSGAVIMNSWTPGVAVRQIGTIAVPIALDFVDLLHRAYEQDRPATA